MNDAERYAVTVRKVLVDDEELWQATVRELPDLAEFAQTRDEAIELALDSIATLKKAALEEGRGFPEPIEDEEEFSGRVTLRMPKSLHREIALKAADEDVSLNWYIVTNLAIGLGERAAAVRRGSEIKPLWTYSPASTLTAAAVIYSVGTPVIEIQDVGGSETRAGVGHWLKMLNLQTGTLSPSHEDDEVGARRRRRAAARN